MKLSCSTSGDLYVEPEFLAGRLCLTQQELRRRMRIGLVTSLVEAGAGDDEGRRRVTVRCGRIAWRAIVDHDNVVTSEEMVSLDDAPRQGCSALRP